MVVMLNGLFVAPVKADYPPADFWLIKDINPGPNGSEITRQMQLTRPMIQAAGQVYFTADDGVHGIQLWVTDGTTQGTRMVFDLGPLPTDGYRFINLIAADGRKLYFAVSLYSSVILYITDGTDTGTVLLKQFDQYELDVDASYVIQNGKFFLTLDSQGPVGFEILVSSGTPETTKVLWTLTGSDWISPLVATSSRVFFETGRYFETDVYGGMYGWEMSIWRTDGTIAGTSALKNNFTGHLGIRPGVQGDKVYFSASSTYPTKTDSGEQELWLADGITGAVQKVYTFSHAWVYPEVLLDTVMSFTGMNGEMFFYFLSYRDNSNGFTMTESIWKTNGTAVGTVKITQFLWPYDSFPLSNPLVAGNLLYYLVPPNGLTTEWTLERTNGTIPGTIRVYTSAPTPQGSMAHYPFVRAVSTNSPGTILFTSEDPYGTNVLYRSDGTETGTIPLKTLPDYPWISQYGWYSAGTYFGSLYFDLGDSQPPKYLWRTDWTVGGTEDISFAGNYTYYGVGPTVNGTLLMIIDDTGVPGGDHGAELWGFRYQMNHMTYLPAVRR